MPLKTWRCIVDLQDDDLQKRTRVVLILQCGTNGQAQSLIYYIFGSSPNVEPFIVQITELTGTEQLSLFTI